MPHSPKRRFGIPLGMQLIALLVCALAAAQLVTLVLAVLFPPAPVSRWNLAEVARTLKGDSADAALEREVMAGPPDLSAPGWLVSESARQALAGELGRAPGDVVLAFYTQLPVGGVALDEAGTHGVRSATTLGWLIGTAQAQSMPGGPLPGGALPGGRPGGFPGGLPPGGAMPRTPAPGQGAIRPPQGAPRTPDAAVPAAARGPLLPAGGGPRIGAGLPAPRPAPVALPSVAPPAPVITSVPVPALPRLPEPAVAMPEPAVQATPAAREAEPPVPANRAAPPAALAAQPAAAASPATARPQPLPFRQQRSGLLERFSPQFIEGDFIAAVRQGDGRWLAVAPQAEPFPNRWQRQLLIWFLASLAVVSPLAWALARRIVRPLEGFARAAETLGRDPTARIIPLSGPAEVGRAANAFNQMRHRLGAFVDDRTAMVGAISHDLRTPLTRLRFRIEDVPEPQREGLLREVTEMEEMISQVIAFIREASTPGPREVIDLAELVAGSVADARLVGGEIALEAVAAVPVEVDPGGLRRVLGNLLENAVKYGSNPRVRIGVAGDEAVVDVIDDGPGIAPDEIERVFEPFYRAEAARRSGKPGSGLGLAVCRSIARAHGGDIELRRGADGFVARLLVPLAFAQPQARAA